MYKEDGLGKRDIETLIDSFGNQALDFFGALRAATYDAQIREWMAAVAGEGGRGRGPQQGGAKRHIFLQAPYGPGLTRDLHTAANFKPTLCLHSRLPTSTPYLHAACLPAACLLLNPPLPTRLPPQVHRCMTLTRRA
jgi:hypothetical protein